MSNFGKNTEIQGKMSNFRKNRLQDGANLRHFFKLKFYFTPSKDFYDIPRFFFTLPKEFLFEKNASNLSHLVFKSK
jgi:hypothetical protein